jgi:glycosyltransferase involved in cell wall biosynthesis
LKLLVISHKRCWRSEAGDSGYATYGGFPLQMRAISALFDATTLVLPIVPGDAPTGSIELQGNNLTVEPLKLPAGEGFRRKLAMLLWIPANSLKIWRLVKSADAIHTPVPGDIGSIGMLIAMLQKKPLFVRHGGNWLVSSSVARKLLKWAMERYAGGKRVMFATGYAEEQPSTKNPNIKWIFSTSLTEEELKHSSVMRTLSDPDGARLIIVCRQDPGKNVDALIRALAELRKTFPALTLSVVGDGSLMEYHKQVAVDSNVEEAVNFHGKLDHEGVMQCLEQADFFVFPTDSEGFPKSVLEALAHGLPVISTGVSVIPYLLSNGSGMILDDSKSDTIVARVTAALNDKNAYSEMSRAACERAAEYSLEKWRLTLQHELETAWNKPLRSQVHST